MSIWVLNKKNVFMVFALFLIFIGVLTAGLNSLSALFHEQKTDSTTSLNIETHLQNQESETHSKEGERARNEKPANAGRKLPIYSVETSKKEVALTFNSAWGNEDIQDLLALFEKHNIKVTFFFVGNWVERFPHSVKAIFEAGHTMGNHSDQHPDMTKLDSKSISTDIQACNERIAKITGESPLYFRAPSGSYDNKTITAAEDLEMISVQWDVDSIDWQDPPAEKIISRVKNGVKNGSIILFHSGKENTYKALPKIIEHLQSEGYSFVSLDKLILKENFYIDHAGRQHKNS